MAAKVTNVYTACDCGLYLCCWHAEFPPETEDGYNLQQYETAAQLLAKTKTEDKETASASADNEVTFGTNKRKATAASRLNKRDKVCITCN